MTKKKTSNVIIFCILCLLVVAFLTPIFFVLINSFKGKLFISNNPFALPTAETFVGLTNYVNGIEKTGFFTAFGWSAFITVFSVAAIILFTSMTAYYLTRVKTGVTNVLYYMFVFSMIVPFQMVMFTMSKLANMTVITRFLQQAETALIDFAVIHGMDIRAEVIGIALLCGHIASRHQILGINKVGITRKSGKRLVRRISIAGGS